MSTQFGANSQRSNLTVRYEVDLMRTRSCLCRG